MDPRHEEGLVTEAGPDNPLGIPLGIPPGGRPGEPARIVIVGGYGAFGIKVAERLARHDDVTPIVAGRSVARADAAAAALATASGTPLRPVGCAMIDAMRPDHAALARIAPAVIINASGPFQAQDYALARAAIAVGAHYIDLADARDFVTGITVLDSQARAAGVLVTSGASSVPAIAAAIIDHHAAGFSSIACIEHCITPANGYDPGIATTASILGGVGQPFPAWIAGQWRTVYGWMGLTRVDCPGLGRRLMADCNVPDLALFPERYRGVRTVRFRAGLEVPMFQLGLWLLACASRTRLLPRPERLARPLAWIKRRLSRLGGDSGGMFVDIAGTGHDGAARRIVVSLIARHNQGPYVPAIAAVVLARALVRGRSKGDTTERGLSGPSSTGAIGAMPCVGLVSLADFQAEVADLAIEVTVSDLSPRQSPGG